MKKQSRILAFALALMMVFACMSVTASAESEKDYSEKITFTMSAIDAASLGIQDDGSESAVWTWLKEKFNVDFDLWPLDWGNYVDQTRIWINTESAPDIMMMDIAAVRYGEFLEWVDAGMLHPYTNLENYPNLSARLDTMSTGKKFIVDGELYAWPAYMDTVEFDYAKIIAYKYRTDWAKLTGMYKEDDTYTWDEWWAMMDKIMELKPGGPDTIGMVTQAPYEFPSYLTIGISPYMLKFTKNADGQWVWGATLPETEEALKFIKEKYDAGVIWKDQPILPDGTGDNEFAAGHLFAQIMDGTSTGAWMGAKGGFEEANEGLVYEDVFSIAKVKAPNGKFVTYQGSDQWSQTGMAASMSDKKVERWMDMLDYLVSDEGYYVRNLGIPGVDWEWNEDGTAKCLWAQDDQGNYIAPYNGVWPWARIAGCNDNFSNYSPSQPDAVKALIIDAMKTYSGPDADIVPLDADIAFFSDPDYLEATAGLEEQTYQKIAELIIKDDFIDQWNAWVAEKSREVQPAVDALNAAFN